MLDVAADECAGDDPAGVGDQHADGEVARGVEDLLDAIWRGEVGGDDAGLDAVLVAKLGGELL